MMQVLRSSPNWQVAMTRLSLQSLALLALFIVSAQAQAQSNATGMPGVTYASGINVPTEDSAITANGGNGSTAIDDTDGLGTFSWQWSAADTNGGDYANISGATNAAFTPGDDQVGKFLRVCASFMDMAATPNMEERCLQITAAVANINDAPVARRSNTAIGVSVNANAADPYVFEATDFPFNDVDKDMLASVIIENLPSRNFGTLALNGTALTAKPTSPITVAQLDAGALTYYPIPNQEPSDPDDTGIIYTSFNFKVTDDGSDGTDNKTSVNFASVNIRLISVVQVDATGSPTIIPAPTAQTPTHVEGIQLGAFSANINDPNGIDGNTLMWQWQQTATSDGTFAAITDATTNVFTPGRAQVGQYIRVCVSFMDSHPMPASEGPLCSVAARVRPLHLRLRLRLFLEGPLR